MLKNRMLKPAMTAGVVLTTMMASSAQAAPIVNYTFESDTLGQPASGWVVGSATPGFNVVADTNNYFGHGTSNQVMNFIDNNTNSSTGAESVLTVTSFKLTQGPSEKFTISYELVYLSGAGANAGLGKSNINSSANKAAVAALGALAGAPSPKYIVSTLINFTGANESFFNPATNLTDTLASGTPGRHFAYNPLTNVTVELAANSGSGVLTDNALRFGFSNGNAGVNNILVDNISSQAGLAVAVPEPASLALLALGGLVMLPRRKR